MMNCFSNYVVTLIGCLGVLSASVFASVTIDDNYGKNGWVSANFQSSADDNLADILIQSDGKIIVAGTSTYSENIVLARLHADGTPDITFGIDGIVDTFIAPTAGPVEEAFTLLQQQDGKLVVAGTTSFNSEQTGGDMVVLRYNLDGSLDASFSPMGNLFRGQVIIDVFGYLDIAYDIIELADNKLLIVGETHNGMNKDIALIRLNIDGTFDTSFSGDGKLAIDISGRDEIGYSVQQQADGKLVVAGATQTQNNSPNPAFDMMAMRINSNGTIDSAFGTSGGLALLNFGNRDDYARGLHIFSNGKILVGGSGRKGSTGANKFALYRLNPDGSKDSSFGSNGSVSPSISSLADNFTTLSVFDSHIYLAGYVTGNDGKWKMGIARLTESGSLDTSFSNDGKVIQSAGTGSARAYAIAVQLDGKVLLAGDSDNGADLDFTLVRYQSDGTLDSAFNQTGMVFIDTQGSEDRLNYIDVTLDGKLVMVGHTTASESEFDTDTDTDMAVARFLPNGLIDMGFADNGLYHADISEPYPNSVSHEKIVQVEVQADGKIVLVGTRFTGANSNFLLVRLLENGSLDTSFNQTGTFANGHFPVDYEKGLGLKLQANNDIIIALDLDYTVASQRIPAVLRYTSVGTFDPSFAPEDEYRPDIFGERITCRPSRDGMFEMWGGEHNQSQLDEELTFSSFQEGSYSTGYVNLHREDEESDLIEQTLFDVDCSSTLSERHVLGLVELSTREVIRYYNSLLELFVDLDVPGATYKEPRAIVAQGDGKVLVSGIAEISGDKKIFLTRVIPSEATQDSSFGENGLLLIDPPGGDQFDIGKLVHRPGAFYIPVISHGNFKAIKLTDTELDSDLDGIADVVEERLGTDPLDDSDTPSDNDSDGMPDVLDDDDDNDNVIDTLDNCPLLANMGQDDNDNDGFGDVCDNDIDGDGVVNELDLFPYDSNEWADIDADGIGDNSDTDDDNDGLTDDEEIRIGSDPLAFSTCPGPLCAVVSQGWFLGVIAETL